MTTLDYLENKENAWTLAKKIESYWHRLGHHKVKAWLEEEVRESGLRFWYVRSNITFNCNSIKVK